MNNIIEKTFDPFQYNLDVEDELFKTHLKQSVKYSVVEIKRDNDILKKYFIIDIRNLSNDKIKYIFDNIDELQRVILSDFFFEYHEIKIDKQLSTYPYNLDLIFLVTQGQDCNIDKYSILYNMKYALKSFMTKERLDKLLTRQSTFKNVDKERLLELKDRIITLKHFNYIFGYNGSGKTRLLSEISKKLYMPIFSMDDLGLNLESEIKDKDSLKYIMYNLSGTYDIDNSEYSKYIYKLSQILQFSKEHNNTVLLDDLRWLSLDSRNYVKLINGLAEYSYEHNPIVLTGCQDNEFIKRKVYKSNIILANNK